MLKVEVNGMSGVGLLVVLSGLSICAVKTVKENKALKTENRTLNKALDIYEIANGSLSRELDEYEKRFGKLNKEKD